MSSLLLVVAKELLLLLQEARKLLFFPKRGRGRRTAIHKVVIGEWRSKTPFLRSFGKLSWRRRRLMLLPSSCYYNPTNTFVKRAFNEGGEGYATGLQITVILGAFNIDPTDLFQALSHHQDLTGN